MKLSTLALILPFLLLIGSINLVAFDTGFYLAEFNRLGIYNQIPADDANRNLVLMLGYFKGKNALDNSFFNEREKLHLEDVKSLLRYAGYLSYALAGVAALLIFKRKRVHDDIINGGLLTLIFISVILLLSVNFDSAFYRFHLVFFRNDYWILDPAKDKLIQLFPQGFFIDAFRRVVAYASLFSIALISIGVIWKKLV